MKKHEHNLDILRGIIALIVVLRHIVSYSSDFDPTYSISSYINSYNPPAHLAVLIFFILSGYVIKLNTKPLTNKNSVLNYLKKRALRLVPIYFVVVLITSLITWNNHSPSEIISNLLFISVPLDNVIYEASPIWSLHFELLFYIIYIFFSYYNINIKKTIICLLTILILLFPCSFKINIHPIIPAYLIGFLFWISGVQLATMKQDLEIKFKDSRKISIFLLFFSLQYFNPFGTFLKVFKIPDLNYSKYSFFQQPITFSDLYFLPYVVLLILVLTKTYYKHFKLLLIIILFFSVARLLMIYSLHGIEFMFENSFLIPSLTLITSIILWIIKFDLRIKIKSFVYNFIFIGEISYGIYLIHVPLLFYIAILFPTSGSEYFFMFKVISLLSFIIISAYVLEKKFNLWIKKIANNPKLAGAQNKIEIKSDGLMQKP